jgi:hypothetical protein
LVKKELVPGGQSYCPVVVVTSRENERNTFAKSSVDECEFLWVWLEKNTNGNLNHLKIFASTNGTDNLMANDKRYRRQMTQLVILYT